MIKAGSGPKGPDLFYVSEGKCKTDPFRKCRISFAAVVR